MSAGGTAPSDEPSCPDHGPGEHRLMLAVQDQPDGTTVTDETRHADA